MKLAAVVLASAVALSGCAASTYAHQNFDMAAQQNFTDPDTKQVYYIRDKPAEGRMKLMLGGGAAYGLLVVGRNGVPPAQLFEQAAVKFLASQGRTCTSERSFEIIMGEMEVTYTCAS